VHLSVIFCNSVLLAAELHFQIGIRKTYLNVRLLYAYVQTRNAYIYLNQTKWPIVHRKKWTEWTKR